MRKLNEILTVILLSLAAEIYFITPLPLAAEYPWRVVMYGCCGEK